MTDAPMTYEEMAAALERAMAAPPSPAVVAQAAREREAERRRYEAYDAQEAYELSDEYMQERWFPDRGDDPRWAITDRARSGIDRRVFDVNGERSL